MSPTSQNELISIIGKYIIIEEIEEVNNRSISADKVTAVYVHLCRFTYIYIYIYI